MTTHPAGWYPNPDDPTTTRWWDGTAWTEHVHKEQQEATPLTAVAEVHEPAQGGEASQPKLSRWDRRRIEKDHAALLRDLEPLRAEFAALQDLHAVQTRRLQVGAELARIEGLIGPARDVAELHQQREQLSAEVRRLIGIVGPLRELGEVVQRRDAARAEVAELDVQARARRAELGMLSEADVLAEIGLYVYHHPLDDAPDYKAALQRLTDQMKQMARSGRAISATKDWTVNGNARAGTKMVSDFSKLLLRAYNNEADHCVRTVKPHTVDSVVTRLGRSRDSISKLGKTMDIAVTPLYHQLRIEEIRLTADYLMKVAEEKERVREERERARDEAAARKELEAAQARLRKEVTHRMQVLESMRAAGTASPEELEAAGARAAEAQDALEGVIERAANTRAGYVYVISNVGAFGPGVVKVGMTRRLDPMDRVRELGDASVPFRFDVHALIFSEDAVALEAHLHAQLESRRVNLVNLRREFFYASPQNVRDLLAATDANLLEFVEEPGALEWHQSTNIRATTAGSRS